MLSDVYFPRVNGVSTSIQTVRAELARRGHFCTLVAPAYPQPAEGPDDTDIVRVPSRYVVLDAEDRMMRPRELRRLIPRLADGAYDLVHVQTPFVAHYLGASIARRLRAPCVATYHTLFEDYLGHYAPFLPDALLRAAARRFSRAQCNAMDGVAVPSNAMRERLREYGVATRLRIVPTGIPAGQFAAGDGDRFRRSHRVAPGRPVLLYVGRVAFEKNISFLLRVLARVRNEVPGVLLVIAGEGPALPAHREETARLGLERAVRFVGYLARDHALRDCYAAADAFVFSSRTETQGLVLLEAMALGIPVVSTAVMGTRDILLSGRGALVAEEREVDFAAQVVRILSDGALRARLGAEARELAALWSAEACTERLVGFYQEVRSAAMVQAA
jgi:glycosyltransferase involved in cell wall biosynthesis